VLQRAPPSVRCSNAVLRLWIAGSERELSPLRSGVIPARSAIAPLSFVARMPLVRRSLRLHCSLLSRREVVVLDARVPREFTQCAPCALVSDGLLRLSARSTALSKAVQRAARGGAATLRALSAVVRRFTRALPALVFQMWNRDRSAGLRRVTYQRGSLEAYPSLPRPPGRAVGLAIRGRAPNASLAV
jgi:hypothetical protein